MKLVNVTVKSGDKTTLTEGFLSPVEGTIRTVKDGNGNTIPIPYVPRINARTKLELKINLGDVSIHDDIHIEVNGKSCLLKSIHGSVVYLYNDVYSEC